jgi:hypothetical protein
MMTQSKFRKLTLDKEWTVTVNAQEFKELLERNEAMKIDLEEHMKEVKRLRASIRALIDSNASKANIVVELDVKV